MEGSIEQLLILTAEVSIATVALSGITMILAVSNLGLTFEKVASISGQLNMASVVAIFSMIPLFLDQLEITQVVLWRTASSLYIITIVLLVSKGLLRGRSNQKAPAMVRIVLVPGVSGLILLPLNIWFVSVWPYLFQLLIAWVVSLTLFLIFIMDILDDKIRKGGT